MASSCSTNTSSPGRARQSARKLLMLVTALALVAAGCNGDEEADVVIEYRQVAYFTEYRVTPETSNTPGLNGAYVLYRLTSVENNSGGEFSLNPNRLIAVSDNESREHAAHEAELLGDNLLENVTVEEGETREDLGCVILVARPDDFQETFGDFRGTFAQIDLEYAGIGTMQVQMDRELGNTGFDHLEPGTPENIQQACQEEG